MLIGYMRVSSDNDRQTTALQRDALLAAGVDARHLFEDKASGARGDRPGLAQALDYVRPGDCLVVWKLDRLGRSLSHLLAIVTALQTRGVAFRSLTEQMDTTTPHGSVSNVDIDGNNTLLIKAIGVTISTFETLPSGRPIGLRE